MKKIFISYADENMSYSLKQIGKQARRLKIFDEVLLYTPEQLPAYIKESPLMAFGRGGGYWAWKPAIIWETLQRYDDGDMIIYTDAGCHLNKSEEWDTWSRLMNDYHTIVFQYRDEMPEWRQWGQTSTQIRHWTKRSTFRYFEELLGDYGEYNKILGGLIICKGKNNPFIKHWLDITLQHPELVMDLSEEETGEQIPYFAFHKHDMCLITPLAHLHASEVLVLTETCETEPKTAAVAALRIRAKTAGAYRMFWLKRYMRNLLGSKVFDKIKHKAKA